MEDDLDILDGWSAICSYVNHRMGTTVPQETIKSWGRRYSLPAVRNCDGTVYSRREYIDMWIKDLNAPSDENRLKEQNRELKACLIRLSEYAEMMGLGRLAVEISEKLGTPP